MDIYIYYIVLTLSYCAASDEAAACDLKEDTYYFNKALHCEQVRREMSLMYEDFYSNVDLQDSSCEPLVVKLDPENMPMWDNREAALEAAKARMAYVRQALGAAGSETD